MTIKIGDRLPQATFRTMGPDGPQPKTTDDLFAGRKVVLVAVPGAFTPSCDRNHLPGYVANADAFRAAGADAILVTSVNDVFVQKAWAAASGAADKVEMLADGNADFAKAVGLAFDGSGYGLGTRSQRYAMLVEDGVVTQLGVEDSPSKVDVASAENFLKAMQDAKAG